MELNLTLFIQMGHFFIAWLLLRTLYFKPAVDLLDQREQNDVQLGDSIRKWQSANMQKEQKIQTMWSGLKRFSAKHRPDITQSDYFLFKELAPSFEPEPLSQQQLDMLEKEVSQVIVSGVAHVDI